MCQTFSWRALYVQDASLIYREEIKEQKPGEGWAFIWCSMIARGFKVRQTDSGANPLLPTSRCTSEAAGALQGQLCGRDVCARARRLCSDCSACCACSARRLHRTFVHRDKELRAAQVCIAQPSAPSTAERFGAPGAHSGSVSACGEGLMQKQRNAWGPCAPPQLLEQRWQRHQGQPMGKGQMQTNVKCQGPMRPHMLLARGIRQEPKRPRLPVRTEMVAASRWLDASSSRSTLQGTSEKAAKATRAFSPPLSTPADKGGARSHERRPTPSQGVTKGGPHRHRESRRRPTLSQGVMKGGPYRHSESQKEAHTDTGSHEGGPHRHRESQKEAHTVIESHKRRPTLTQGVMKEAHTVTKSHKRRPTLTQGVMKEAHTVTGSHERRPTLSQGITKKPTAWYAGWLALMRQHRWLPVPAGAKAADACAFQAHGTPGTAAWRRTHLGAAPPNLFGPVLPLHDVRSTAHLFWPKLLHLFGRSTATSICAQLLLGCSAATPVWRQCRTYLGQRHTACEAQGAQGLPAALHGYMRVVRARHVLHVCQRRLVAGQVLRAGKRVCAEGGSWCDVWNVDKPWERSWLTGVGEQQAMAALVVGRDCTLARNL